MNELIEKTNELLQIMQDQLHSKFEHTHDESYTFTEGRNYLKLIRYKKHGHKTVVGFVVKKSPTSCYDNKTNRPFQVGDMLMAATWNKPATNFSRGNVFDGYNKETVRWTGI